MRIEVDGQLPDRPDLGDPVDPGDPGTPPPPIPPALRTWSRLEPLPQSTGMQVALQAGVADPLWLLGRQWQFLEFAAEDAGTPIEVRITAETGMLSRYRAGTLVPGTGTGGDAVAYDASLPLEVLVEAEPVRAVHPRVVADAGLHLGRMLRAADLGAAVARLVEAFPLVPEEPDAEAGGADTRGAEWLELARGRALDAGALVAALSPLRAPDGTLRALPATFALPAATRPVLERWLRWYEDDIVDPPANDAWNRSRQEYAFAVGGELAGEDVVLSADEYTDGTFDWSSLSRGTPGALGRSSPPRPPETVTLPVAMPSPVDYAGMPADRFWEFEDAEVHFGAIEAGPTDLTRLLLVEFALVYGNDWFVVPVVQPVGSILRPVTFAVRDTFGVETVVEPTREQDGTPWRLFQIDELGGGLLAPALGGSLSGEPIEQVVLLRDELANMAWGVERTVQGISGDPYDRTDEAARRAAARQQVEGPPVAAELVYRLATPVPEHWIPFVPVAAAGSAADAPGVDLERRELLRTEATGDVRPVRPRGALIGGTAPLRIAEEEVPREGAIVERAFQHARWLDGRSLLWLGRRKTAGRGEGASGLRFDALDRR